MTSPENKPSTNKRICLGKITAPHGINGLVKIFAYGEDANLIQNTDKVFTSKDEDKTIKVTLENSLGKYILASVEGCNSRDDADLIKGTEFWVSRDDLPELDDGFYIEDLGGLTAFNENKEKIGTIITVQNYGAGDLLEVKPKSGMSYFVPFKDEYVPEINLEEKYITILNADNFIIE